MRPAPCPHCGQPMANGQPLPEDRCGQCGCLLAHSHTGRRRRYCSEGCKSKAYRGRSLLRDANRLESLASQLQALTDCHETKPIATKRHRGAA